MSVAKVSPQHIAIIMDGNGRWATARAKPRTFGHEQGAKTLKQIVKYCIDAPNISHLTVFALSLDNHLRPKAEVENLFTLLERNLLKEIVDLHSAGIKLNIIGDKSLMTPKLQQSIKYVEDLTAENNKLNLTIAVNYSGQWDILQAVNSLQQQDNATKYDLEDISNNLATKDLPNPDLLIRTGGQVRLSNFLLWQMAYTELYFIDKLWPDFEVADLETAIEHFASRIRNFGNINNVMEY